MEAKLKELFGAGMRETGTQVRIMEVYVKCRTTAVAGVCM